MHTRDDYMDKKCTHREYYSQFVTPGLRQRVEWRIGRKRIVVSSDPHFNDIPLKMWDTVTPEPVPYELANAMKACGDYVTLAGLVCIAKEAAEQMREQAAAVPQ